MSPESSTITTRRSTALSPCSNRASTQTFAGHTDSGKRTLPFVRFAATYGVAFLANAWNPDRLSDRRHAIVRGTVTLGADAGNNLFDEFWPDLKKKFFHRKRHPAVVT